MCRDLHNEVLADDIIALVVDVSRSKGSVRFYAVSDDSYIDMVGQEVQGLVMVPLEVGWRYVCFGECRVGKIVQL